MNVHWHGKTENFCENARRIHAAGNLGCDKEQNVASREIAANGKCQTAASNPDALEPALIYAAFCLKI